MQDLLLLVLDRLAPVLIVMGLLAILLWFVRVTEKFRSPGEQHSNDSESHEQDRVSESVATRERSHQRE